MSEGEIGVESVAEGGEAVAGVATASSILGGEAGGGAEAQAEAAWHDGMNLSGDTVQLLEAKGWHKHENPIEQLSQGYRNAERLRGVQADQLVRIPEPGNEEQMSEWRTRMGVPEAPEGYELPDVTVHGEAFDTSLVAGIAHAIDATPAQAERLAAAVGQALEAGVLENQANAQASVAAQTADWVAAQGDKYEENVIHADRGFDALGWDDDFVNALKLASPDGLAKAMNAAVMIGRLTAESRRGDDGERGDDSWKYGLTKEAARQQLTDHGDELSRKARAGDKAATKRYNELKRVAFGT